MFDLCQEYENERPRHYIVNNTEYNGSRIGLWLDNRKRAFMIGRVYGEELTQLRTLRTWRHWESSHADDPIHRFRYMAELCRDYAPSAEDIISVNTVCNGEKIGLWLANRKRHFLNGSLTDEELEILDSIPRWQVWMRTVDNPQ